MGMARAGKLEMAFIKAHLPHGSRSTSSSGAAHAGADRAAPQFGDQPQDLCKQHPRHRNLGHLEGDIAAVADDLRADLDQLLLQAGQRPVLDRLGRRQGAQEVAEIVGERVKLEPDGVGREPSASQPRPADRSLTLFIHRPPCRAGCKVMSGRAGDHPAWPGPASSPIAKAGVSATDMVRVAPDRALEQMTNPLLQDQVGGEPDRILDPLVFQVLIDCRHGEGRVGAEVDARYLAPITGHDRVEHVLPAVGTKACRAAAHRDFEIANGRSIGRTDR